jgi:hypothetical protein
MDKKNYPQITQISIGTSIGKRIPTLESAIHHPSAAAALDFSPRSGR